MITSFSLKYQSMAVFFSIFPHRPHPTFCRLAGSRHRENVDGISLFSVTWSICGLQNSNMEEEACKSLDTGKGRIARWILSDPGNRQ